MNKLQRRLRMAGKTGRFIVHPKPVEQLVHHDMSKIKVLNTFMDSSMVPEADVVLMVNEIKKVAPDIEHYIEPHKHDATQLYTIIGDLTVEVFLEDERHEVQGPACIFIPAGMKHALRELKGSGYLVVVVRQGKYE